MHRFFLNLSRLFAFLGGGMLAALVLMTCVSVIGRWVNGALHGMVNAEVASGPAQFLLDWGLGAVTGDFELVEAGIAFAIFAFLPLCQITNGHAAVDIFTTRLPPRADRALRAVIEVTFAAILVLIAVQLGAGMFSKFRSGQTTLILQFPLWWAYALSLGGAVVAALVGCYMAAMRMAEAWSGHALLPPDQGA
jgi:TRAP-type C4-dicarboxylate transport system permease small subunit